VPHIPETKNQQILKAGALLCPVCCVEFLEIEIDFEIDGVIVRDVKVLRCPVCQDEQFTPEQQKAIEEKLGNTPNH
jgi:hypothetical protein